MGSDQRTRNSDNISPTSKFETPFMKNIKKLIGFIYAISMNDITFSSKSIDK